MHRLPGHTQRIPDLLPGPTLFPRPGHRHRLDLLRQPMQRTHSTQPDSGLLRTDALREFAQFHYVSLG